MHFTLTGSTFVAFAASGLFLWGSLRLRRRHRLLRDTPTSKAAGVFIGAVELQGTAESDEPRISQVSRTPCVWCHYEVTEKCQRQVTTSETDKDGNTSTSTTTEIEWRTIVEGGVISDFYVRDETGAVLVRPAGARITGEKVFDQTCQRGDPLYTAHASSEELSDSEHQRRIVETAIPLHHPVFVVGRARERRDVVAPEIAKSAEAEIFLISSEGEAVVTRNYATGSWVCFLLGLVLVMLARESLGQDNHTVTPAAAFARFAAAYLALFVLGWVVMVHNSLIRLRERVRQAWSLVDVQLQRRHDLIPRLSAICAGLAGHEAHVQTALAALRTQSQATAPGMEGPDPAGLAATLRVLVERYPDLKAREGFERLHAQLIETEQRIALARDYYNEIATHFATRLEIMPDCWVAALRRMQPMELLSATSFERAPLPLAKTAPPALAGVP